MTSRRGESHYTKDIGQVTTPCPDAARRMALHACAHATDLDDARVLVDMVIDREWLEGGP